MSELEQGVPERQVRAKYTISPQEIYDLKRRYPQRWATYDRARRIGATLTAPLEKRPIMQTSLEDYRRKVHGRKTYRHMAQWVEWMEDPDARKILIVTRPDTAKTTFLREYCLYRLARDPANMRIAYASASERHAEKQVNAMRMGIEANLELRALAGDLATSGRGDSRAWSKRQFMVAQRSFSAGSEEADYSVAAVGIGGQILGSRNTLFIVDDADKPDLSDPEREAIWENLLTVVDSRLTNTGKLIILTNRWDQNDIAARIIRLSEAGGDWRVYSSPAIIRERDPSRRGDWGEVLWPERFGSATDDPAPKLTPTVRKRAWEKVTDKRRELFLAGKESKWALVYQCNPAETNDYDFAKVIDRALERGKDVHWGHVPSGATVVNAIDPATYEPAAALCLAVTPDAHTVVDIKWGRRWRTEGLYQTMRDYGAFFRDVSPARRWWALEGQGPWITFAEGPESKAICSEQAAQRVPLKTGENKTKGDFAVSALVPVVRDKLVIPNHCPECIERMAPFVQQLRRYHPDTTEPYDCAITLWLAERVVVYKDLETVPSSGSQRSAWQSSYSNWSGGSWALK